MNRNLGKHEVINTDLIIKLIQYAFFVRITISLPSLAPTAAPDGLGRSQHQERAKTPRATRNLGLISLLPDVGEKGWG